MNTAKIKNFIIILLAVANVFLIGITVADKIESSSVRREAEELIVDILAERGIVLAGGVEAGADTLHSFAMKRDFNAEEKIVRALFGRADSEDLGGNIIYYRGETGQATFRGTGEFDISFEAGAVTAEGDIVKTAKRVLKKLGLTPDRLVASESQGDEYTLLTLSYLYEDKAVYNSRVAFTFNDGNLLLISGRRILDTPSIQADEAPIDSITALMRFLDMVNKEGFVCSEIRALDAGYITNVSSVGGISLVPVWRIETDTGEYFINGLTGKSASITY